MSCSKDVFEAPLDEEEQGEKAHCYSEAEKTRILKLINSNINNVLGAMGVAVKERESLTNTLGSLQGVNMRALSIQLTELNERLQKLGKTLNQELQPMLQTLERKPRRGSSFSKLRSAFRPPFSVRSRQRNQEPQGARSAGNSPASKEKLPFLWSRKQ
ncbi:MAG: hypothetical protein AAFP93_01735 [Bacteroidota bacterium]